MATAAIHLSVQLMAPEQPFHATTATKSVFAGSTRDRTEQISQDESAKHRTLTQGTHQQITEHKPAKTTVPERRVKLEISNCSITLHVLYYPALWHSFVCGLTTTLTGCITATHSVTDWSISPFLEYLVQFSNTSASSHVRLSASLSQLATSSLAFTSYWDTKSLPWVLAWCLIVLAVKKESSCLLFLNKTVNRLPQYYSKFYTIPNPLLIGLYHMPSLEGFKGVALGDMV